MAAKKKKKAKKSEHKHITGIVCPPGIKCYAVRCQNAGRDILPAHTKGTERLGAVGRHFGKVGEWYDLELKCIAKKSKKYFGDVFTFKDDVGHTFVSSADDIRGVVGTHNKITVRVLAHDFYAGVRRTLISAWKG